MEANMATAPVSVFIWLLLLVCCDRLNFEPAITEIKMDDVKHRHKATIRG